jgi:hypothetical protein
MMLTIKEVRELFENDVNEDDEYNPMLHQMDQFAFISKELDLISDQELNNYLIGK